MLQELDQIIEIRLKWNVNSFDATQCLTSCFRNGTHTVQYVSPPSGLVGFVVMCSVLETIVRPSALFFAIVRPVLNRFTAFDYPFGIFKLITIAGQLNTNNRRIIFSNTTIDSHRSVFVYKRTIMITFTLIWINGQLNINCFIPEIHWNHNILYRNWQKIRDNWLAEILPWYIAIY